LQDGTLNLILRHRFEKEIAEDQDTPDLRIGFREQIAALQKENNSLRGKLNQVIGVMAEYQFANTLRSRKRFQWADFFAGATDDTELNITGIRTRVVIQRDDGKTMEIDIVAESNEGRVLLVEVRKRQKTSNRVDVEDFQEKIAVYQAQNSEKIVLAGFLSLGGFTKEAQQLCEQLGIGWAETLSYF
jgi:hypothetical protein